MTDQQTQVQIMREIKREMGRFTEQALPAPPPLMARAARMYLEMGELLGEEQGAVELRSFLHESAAGGPHREWAEAVLALLADEPFWRQV